MYFIHKLIVLIGKNALAATSFHGMYQPDYLKRRNLR